MRYLKDLLAGIAAAIIAVVIWIAALIGWSTWRLDAPHDGIGVLAVVVTTTEIILAAIVGFVIGLWWRLRRRRNRSDLTVTNQ